VSSERLLSRMLDEQGSALVHHRLAQGGVRILTRTDASRIVGRNARVRSVVAATGEELPADLVILAKGIRPNAEVAETGGVAVGRGILVDHHMRTSRPGVFAAGDCAESPDLLAPGRRTIAGTWFEAVSQGETAGVSLLGGSHPTLGTLKMNVMAVRGVAVASIGMTEAPNGDGEVLVSSRDGVYRKLVISQDRIVGAVLVGDVSEAGLIASLIRRGLTRSELHPIDLSRPIRYSELGLLRGVRYRDSEGRQPLSTSPPPCH
ncbi:MAG TPA: FAD-dependent oxidoreductase, partial [Candidatus Acidoferrum sp.]|nr:FAD-dependent oxidoreductase [Candidatus Acidoferrum sp.]